MLRECKKMYLIFYCVDNSLLNFLYYTDMERQELPLRKMYKKCLHKERWQAFIASIFTIIFNNHSPVRKSLTEVCSKETSSKMLVHIPDVGLWLAMPTHICDG